MFEDYKKEVTLAYKGLLKTNNVSTNLINLSPAKLRDECLIIYKERPLPEDEVFLRSFFEPLKEEVNYYQIIKDSKIDKFRPLINYLNDNEIDSHDRNIELLAWLINFKPRPFTVWQKGKALSKSKPNWYKSKIAKSIIATSLLAGATGGVYKIVNKRECMYWTGERYECISCNRKINAVQIIPLDTFLLNNFKRITKPDTLTKKSIGKVWYVRVNGTREYFTADGKYPLDSKRDMHPLTEWIINHPIKKKPSK